MESMKVPKIEAKAEIACTSPARRQIYLRVEIRADGHTIAGCYRWVDVGEEIGVEAWIGPDGVVQAEPRTEEAEAAMEAARAGLRGSGLSAGRNVPGTSRERFGNG